ncbi:Helix-loop-helix domain containing protein, partial [Euroglyphus maynei]
MKTSNSASSLQQQQSTNIMNIRDESFNNNPTIIAKHKPPPLSKYRRKTANLRERSRMQEINDAFKRLQSVVPDIFSITENERSNQSMAKLTKINTLKLAVNYISALTQILRQTESETEPTYYGHDENSQTSKENPKDNNDTTITTSMALNSNPIFSNS